MITCSYPLNSASAGSWSWGRSVESEEISDKNRPKYVKIGQNMKIYLLTMIVNHFPKIVKDILKGLPKNDYPVLNSRLFVECWLAYTLDNSLTRQA